MKKRFVVIVLDGFGVGAMADNREKRPQDVLANTAKSIFNKYPEISWKNLEKLGLMNVLGFETENMHYSPTASYGKCNLMHFGADTFLGHQEIMGTKTKVPVAHCFQDVKQEVRKVLEDNGYSIRSVFLDELEYFVVNEAVTVSDNIDSDLGMAMNCIATFDKISFEELLKIGKLVRSVVTCNRVIAFGGSNVTIDDIINAQEVKEKHYIGNVAVKTGVYENNYEVRHLGYGVDETNQAPYLLGKEGINVTLLGKVADVCQNHFGKSISCVPTGDVMDLVIDELKTMDEGFICANVQETDLAGHSMNTEWYKEVLTIVDNKLNEVLPLIGENDTLLICADHGNDPEIGHNHHTREQVPLLLMSHSLGPGFVGERNTLSDIGATVCKYFDVTPCQNGTAIF